MKRIAVVLLLLLTMIFSVFASKDSFVNETLEIKNENGKISVSGSFDATDYFGKEFNIFLATYMDNNVIEKVELSKAFMIKDGANTFEDIFEFVYNEQKTRAFVLTEDLVPICKDLSMTVDRYISWLPNYNSFYDELSSEKNYDKDTDFSVLYEDDKNVSIIESIAIMSNLHAKYNNTDVTSREDAEYSHVLEMDDPSVIVDLSERNSVNKDGINFNKATGEIDDGILTVKSVLTSGSYDPQIIVNGLKLDARKYRKITLRMRMETVDSSSSLANSTLQVFFKTNSSSKIDEDKSIRYKLSNVEDVTEWFEIELEMGANAGWKDVVTGIRLDPANANGIFYIDYIEFSDSDTAVAENWYDTCLDYAFDNGIVSLGRFMVDDYENDITREEFFRMLVSVFPEDFFAVINDIKALPDIQKNQKYAEIYLMLYRAGITLGFDVDGNLSPERPIKRSEVSAIINRLFVEKNRLCGTVEASWEDDEYEYDVEFDSEADLKRFAFRKTSSTESVVDGHLVYSGEYDSGMYMDGVSINADKYTKLRVRIRADYDTEPVKDSDRSYEVYFKPDDYNGTITDYHLSDIVTDYYLDPLGWYIVEMDLCLHNDWNGTVNYFRFDPMNASGTYTIDYIRFIKSDYYELPDEQSLIDAGYIATRLMQDEHFERGFYVSRVDQSVSSVNHGKFTDYCETDESPLWQIGPWWQGTGDGMIDLIENRDMSADKYTLADTYGINTIIYNPEEKSITQRLNATKIYNGEPHDADTYQWWPHQLIEQNTTYTGDVDKERNSADADRIFVELDVRMTDFKNTTNTEGMNVCSYLIYFYLRPKASPSDRIWFGLVVFNTTGSSNLTASKNVKPNWSPDSAAHQYMYGMPQAVVFDGIENSFNPSAGVASVGDEWKKIRLDVTPHIDRAIEWANRDNIFGIEVAKEDMYFDGVNIGYEIHGNYDCTFEFKNFNMVAYNLPD